MTSSEDCRAEALKLCERANKVLRTDLKAEYEALAFAYMCLAEQIEAERNEWSE